MTSRWSQRRAALRSILAGQACIYPASVFDPLSARMAQDIGFEMAMMAGSVASMTVLGAPDLITLTLTELAEQAHRINRATTLPLLVDADHGYGNALNVMRTVEELETVGVAALSIEDTELPTPFGSVGTTRLISRAEAEAKLRAAVQVRHDPQLVIAGRTHAGAQDQAQLLERIRCYQDTGVDALFIVKIKTKAQIEAISQVANIPVILGAVPTELMDSDFLSQHQIRICLQGHQPFKAAMYAAQQTLQALRAGQGNAPTGIADAEALKQLTRHEDYERWRRDYL